MFKKTYFLLALLAWLAAGFTLGWFLAEIF